MNFRVKFTEQGGGFRAKFGEIYIVSGDYEQSYRDGYEAGYEEAGKTLLPTLAALIDRSLTHIDLPEGLETIGKNVFQGCSRMVSITIPDSVITIDTQAFYACTSLKLGSLPPNLRTLSSMCFQNCYALAITEIPGSVMTIGSQVFYGCRNIEKITFKGKPNSIGNNAFGNCTLLTTINVPWAEGEVSGAPWGAANATINYNAEVQTIWTLKDFTPGFVNKDTGAVEENKSFPDAVVSPLTDLEAGKVYELNSDITATTNDQGMRIRIYDENGKFVLAMTIQNLNNEYMTVAYSGGTNYYMTKTVTMTVKKNCKIRINYLDADFVTTAKLVH